MAEPRPRLRSPIDPGDDAPTREVRLFQAQRHPRCPDPDTLETRPYLQLAPWADAAGQASVPTVVAAAPTLPSSRGPRSCGTTAIQPSALRGGWRARSAWSGRAARIGRRIVVAVLLSAALALGLAAFVTGWSARRSSAPARRGSSPVASSTARDRAAPAPARAPAAEDHAPGDAALAAPLDAPAATPRSAAAQLARGSYAAALAAYRALARAHPEQRVYGLLAALLERRLQQRCQRRLEAGAAPCPELPQ